MKLTPVMVTRPPDMLVAGDIFNDLAGILWVAVTAATIGQSGVVALMVFVDEMAALVGVLITVVNDPVASGRACLISVLPRVLT